MALTANTMTDVAAVRPIGVRRLTMLLRRLARREGVGVVFEPNDRELRRLVGLRFERLLTGLFQRGAFAGAVPAEAFEVSTGDSVNPQAAVESGRFVVEVRFAPSRPLEFITVRLVVAGSFPGGADVIHQTFNFLIRIDTGGDGGALCEAAFAECAGLEISAAPKTIREGGQRRARPPHRSDLLRRARPQAGHERVVRPVDLVRHGVPRRRAAPARRLRDRGPHAGPHRRGLLAAPDRVLLIKLNAPDLNAREGGIAIEAIEIAYQGLRLVPPTGGDRGA